MFSGRYIMFSRRFLHVYCDRFPFLQYTSFCRKLAFVDPSYEEERVMEGSLVIGMNKHRELCCLQSAGSMLLMRDQVNISYL